jgi:hypothetical protein
MNHPPISRDHASAWRSSEYLPESPLLYKTEYSPRTQSSSFEQRSSPIPFAYPERMTNGCTNRFRRSTTSIPAVCAPSTQIQTHVKPETTSHDHDNRRRLQTTTSRQLCPDTLATPICAHPHHSTTPHDVEDCSKQRFRGERRDRK